MNQNLIIQILPVRWVDTSIVHMPNDKSVQKHLLVGPSAHYLHPNAPGLPSARFAGVAMVHPLGFCALKAALCMFSFRACWQFSLIVYSALIFILTLKDLCVC